MLFWNWYFLLKHLHNLKWDIGCIYAFIRMSLYSFSKVCWFKTLSVSHKFILTEILVDKGNFDVAIIKQSLYLYRIRITILKDFGNNNFVALYTLMFLLPVVSSLKSVLNVFCFIFFYCQAHIFFFLEPLTILLLIIHVQYWGYSPACFN